MTKLIALKSGSHELLPDAWNSDFSGLKQQALLFDQIGIYKLDNFYKTLEESTAFFKKLAPDVPNKAESIITELKWLQQTDIIFELTMQQEFEIQNMGRFVQISNGQKFENAKNLLRKIIEIQTLDLKNVKSEAHKIDLIKEQQFTILRLMSVIMEATKGVTAVTTFPDIEYSRELPSSNKSDVAQIVISKLPLPSNETPWEQIIDYRNDSGNQKNLQSLRRWINKISHENLPSIEIEEEIEWLVNEFQEHMKFHKIKANTETLEVIVNSSADVIRNLLTLKFSKVLNPLFVIKKRQLSLLEAEINAPGKEMAYIIKSRETFESQE